MHMGIQTNTSGFNHIKHTYIHNLHKQAYAYKMNSPSTTELEYDRILRELLESCGMRECLFGLSFSAARQIFLRSQSFTKLMLSKVLVRLADAALLM